MPPQVSHCHHLLLSPKPPFHSQISFLKRILHQKYLRGKMKFTKNKLVTLLFFVLCSASIFRFLNISRLATNSPPSIASSVLPQIHESHHNNSLTEKELKFLSEFFSHSVPCNILVFGLQHQYSSIASLNNNGLIVFLEDHHLQKTNPTNSNTHVHYIKYNTVASEAYQLLKDARENLHCSPNINRTPMKCNLAMTKIPREVYNTMWDVVVVDGPNGDGPSSPGRMSSIYTAGVLARRGNGTHVIVHDVDRMIEKWFSWEYLCEENLVSSKGRFWRFQVPGGSNETAFCIKHLQ